MTWRGQKNDVSDTVIYAIQIHGETVSAIIVATVAATIVETHETPTLKYIIRSQLPSLIKLLVF